jgi:hypothetical protein
MLEILKTDEGIFIPRTLIPDFERVEVDTSTPGAITIRSKAASRHSQTVLERMDRRREAIFQRRGLLDDSTILIRQSREEELE